MRLSTKTHLLFALGAAALAACDSSDVTDPSSRLEPSSDVARAGNVYPRRVVIYGDTGYDRAATSVTVGKPATFKYNAYDMSGRSIPPSNTVAPVYSSSNSRIFPINSATGVGTAVATGSVTVSVRVGIAYSSVTIRAVQGQTQPTNQAPTAAISAPASGASSTQGASVTFTGSGADAEDGALSGASLVWTSSINGQIGTGATFSTTSLSVGTHTITLTAKDAQGATGTATRSVTVTSQPTQPPASSKWVTGYYVGYQRSMYPETQVDFTYLTHVVMGTLIPLSNGGIDTTFYIDNVNGPATARNLANRAHQANRKAILMLAGAGYHDALVSASSSANRSRFVTNLVNAMDRLGYDGIDVDWEPINTADMPSALALLQELRAARPNMLITFPVYWVGSTSSANSWYGQAVQYVNQFNIMSYDMAGNWGGWQSWHTSALAGEAANRPSSVSSSVAKYRAVGVPAAKLGFGIGAYGNCWQGVNDMRVNLDGTSANVTSSDNVMTYTNIMTSYYSASAYKWDAAASMGYLSFATPTGAQRCSMISFETPESATAKGQWAKAQGLGGAIIWTINQQRMPSAPAGSQDPLSKALYTSMQ